MAFEWNQSVFADSLFHTLQRQPEENLDGGNNGSGTVPVFSVPNASKQDQETPLFVPWTQEDSRNLPNAADGDGNMDLRTLVSNILDEVDSPESGFDEGLLPRYNSIWSPKTVKEELLQCHQLDAKTQQNHSFQPINNIPGARDIFIPPDEMNSFCFNPFSEDHRIQSGNKPTYHEQYLSEDVSQLVLNLQSLMHPEEFAAYLDSFSNMYKQVVGVNRDDGVAEHWKSGASATRVPNQSGEMKQVLWEHNGATRKQTLKRDPFQCGPDFGSENTSCLHPPPNSAFAQMSFGKMPGHRENVHANGYSKQLGKPKQMQGCAVPQMPNEKQRMPASGFRGGIPQKRAQTSAAMRAGVNQPASQIPYLDFQGNVQLQKFDGESSMGMPRAYPVNDLRNQSRMAFNYSAPPNGSGVSGFTPGHAMLANEPVPINYSGRRGENMHPFTASAMANSVLMNQGCPVVQFSVHLDECHEQWKCLENERMMTERFLMKPFWVKKTPAKSNSNLSKMGPTSAAIDQLIVNQMREQTKVADLLTKMECVYRLSLHVNIRTALSRHHAAVGVLQRRCKEGPTKSNKQQQRRPCFTDSKDVMLMDSALKDLAHATRRLRTALWCSLQMATPLPVDTQDRQVRGEDAAAAAPRQGYSFTI